MLNNLLETNVGKTKSMYFRSKYLNSTSKPFRKLSLGASEIEWVTEYKYLGITFDSGLTFARHLKSLKKNVSFKVHKLARIRNCLKQKTASLLYKRMILMVMDYGDLFYASASKCLLQKLNVLQSKAIRVICKLNSRSNVTAAADSLELLPLCSRRGLHT